MKKILVVDDDMNILEVVEIILTSNGFDIRTHTDGWHVDEVVTDYNPDLILLDIKVAGKSGTDICKELKETHTMPILLFSAYGDPEAVYKECNADGFINKPFEINDFLEEIKRHLKYSIQNTT
jgi:DNA-binding response OmpR family regulator